MPLVLAIRAHVFAAERMHGDDTTVPVLAKERTRTGRLWGYVRDDRPFGGPDPPAVAFFYSPDRSGEHPERHLAGVRRHPAGRRLRRVRPALRPEARAGADPRGRLLGARPAKLFELAAVGKAPIAAEAVRRIDELFAIEREINGRPAAERLAIREERAEPLVAELEAWLRVQHERVSRQVRDRQGDRLRAQPVEGADPVPGGWPICLSDDAAERALRGVAVGRRNWTFAGSGPAGDAMLLVLMAGGIGLRSRRPRTGRPWVLSSAGSFV